MFIQENAFENVVCEKADILSRPQWIKDHEHKGKFGPYAITSQNKPR